MLTCTPVETNPDRIHELDSLFAGNAVFTVVGGNERYTFHLNRPKNGRDKGKLFARLLRGPNNKNDYSDIGQIDPTTGVITLTGRIGKGEKLPESIALIRWLCLLTASGATIPDGITIVGSGECLRCGRMLTVPYPDNPYRLRHLGPECGGK